MWSDETSELNTQKGRGGFAFLKLTKRRFEDHVSVLNGVAFKCQGAHSVFISVLKLSKNNLRIYDSLDILTDDICLMCSEWKMDQVPISLLLSAALNQQRQNHTLFSSEFN